MQENLMKCRGRRRAGLPEGWNENPSSYPRAPPLSFLLWLCARSFASLHICCAGHFCRLLFLSFSKNMAEVAVPSLALHNIPNPMPIDDWWSPRKVLQIFCMENLVQFESHDHLGAISSAQGIVVLPGYMQNRFSNKRMYIQCRWLACPLQLHAQQVDLCLELGYHINTYYLFKNLLNLNFKNLLCNY